MRSLYDLAPRIALTPQPDPAPETTAAVKTLLDALVANQDSDVMSQAYRAWYATARGFRAFFSGQLRAFMTLKYLATDDIAGKPQWETDKLDRLVHYQTEANGRVFHLTIGLTREGKIGRLDILPYR